MNTVEFDEGVFGVQAAAQHYFQVDAQELTALQAARLAAVLPDPKGRDAANPSSFVRGRTRAILSGAATIAEDGRADCFAPQD
jgi:monofunctional biosynthetic peptidoglycan transglycosylase